MLELPRLALVHEPLLVYAQVFQQMIGNVRMAQFILDDGQRGDHRVSARCFLGRTPVRRCADQLGIARDGQDANQLLFVLRAHLAFAFDEPTCLDALPQRLIRNHEPAFTRILCHVPS